MGSVVLLGSKFSRESLGRRPGLNSDDMIENVGDSTVPMRCLVTTISLELQSSLRQPYAHSSCSERRRHTRIFTIFSAAACSSERGTNCRPQPTEASPILRFVVTKRDFTNELNFLGPLPWKKNSSKNKQIFRFSLPVFVCSIRIESERLEPSRVVFNFFFGRF